MSVSVKAYTAQEQANLTLVEAMYHDVLKPLDSTHVDRYIAPDYVQHSPLADNGPQPLKDFLDFIKGESPNAVHNVKRLFADGDHVIAHTHVIRYPGDAGLAVVDIYRIENNLIAEHWDVIQEIDPAVANAASMF